MHSASSNTIVTRKSLRLVRSRGIGAPGRRSLGSLRGCVGLGGPTLLLLFCVGCASQSHAGSLDPQADQSAPPDAVIELWEQSWTLNQDGSIVYHEKKHVRLNSDRTYRALADPRMTYNVDTDELEILVARVKRPDGTYCEQPDYAHVEVSPDASAGWPAFADIRQHLVVMGGVEPSCVLELEYKITSQPGSKPYLAADLRLDDRYPVQARKVTVDTPGNVKVHWRFSHGDRPAPPMGLDVRVKLKNLAAVPIDPQSPPWQTRCARLTFSTAESEEAWLKDRLAQISAAADQSEMITELATEWTKDHKEASDKLRGLQEKLAGSFNFVEFPVAWRPRDPRPASEVIGCNYGLPEEAAALLLALARALELPVRPGLLTADHVWLPEAPQDSMVSVYVVLLDGAAEPEIWEAHRGRIVRDGHWAGYRLLSCASEQLQRIALPAWNDADQSRCGISGKITLNDDGTFTGSLSLRTTGLFVSPENLRSTAAQKRRVNALLKRVLPDAKVESFSVEALSPSEFEVSARIRPSQPLTKTSDCYELALAEDGPFLGDVPLPLVNSRRNRPLWLTGAFDEQIELTIEWPEDWTVEAHPGNVARVGGDWGLVQQSVSADQHSLTLCRHTRLTRRELPAENLLTVRKPLNDLRSEFARTLLLRP